MNTFRRWFLDWTGRAGLPAREIVGDPISIVRKMMEAVSGLVLVVSAPAVAVFLPNLNDNQKIAIYALIATFAVVAAHFILTARDVIPSADSASAGERYRYSGTERAIARGVVVIPLVLVAIGLIPAPAEAKDCALDASVEWTSAEARPLVLGVRAGRAAESNYPVFAEDPIAILVPADHAGAFGLTLDWSDGSRSSFGTFGGCNAVTARASDDGRATVDLSIR